MPWVLCVKSELVMCLLQWEACFFNTAKKERARKCDVLENTICHGQSWIWKGRKQFIQTIWKKAKTFLKASVSWQVDIGRNREQLFFVINVVAIKNLPMPTWLDTGIRPVLSEMDWIWTWWKYSDKWVSHYVKQNFYLTSS